MDPGTNREVIESLAGCGSGLIFFELSCLDNYTRCSLSAHLAHIENKVITISVVPIRAEHRHKPAAARFIDFLYIMPRRNVGQALTRADLLDTEFDRCSQKYFQHMADTEQKLMTEVAVINHLSVVSQFTQRSLKSGSIRP